MTYEDINWKYFKINIGDMFLLILALFLMIVGLVNLSVSTILEGAFIFVMVGRCLMLEKYIDELEDIQDMDDEDENSDM